MAAPPSLKAALLTDIANPRRRTNQVLMAAVVACMNDVDEPTDTTHR